MGFNEEVYGDEEEVSTQPEPELETPAIGSRKRKRKNRGKNKVTFGKHHKEVMVFNELGQPVAPRKTVGKFSRYLGLLSRDTSLFPVNTKDWRVFKNSDNIEKAWEKVKEKLDWSDPEMVKKENMIKTVVMEKLDDRWRHWKAYLRKEHYLPLLGSEERWKCGDDSIDESQWKGLVNMWEDVGMQQKCETYKRNRKHLRTVHRVGPVTYAQARYEYKLREGHEPDRVTFFKMTHTRGDGKPVNEATQEILDDFEKREEEIRKQGEVITEEVRNSLFATVLGPEKRGRVRGYGIGVSWKQIPGIIFEDRGKVSEEVQALRKELEQQRENALNAQKEMERMKAEALEREQRIREEAAAREEGLKHEQQELAAKVERMDSDMEKRVTDKIAEMMRLLGFTSAIMGVMQQSSSTGMSPN